jgi:plasmid replication initiation protein
VTSRLRKYDPDPQGDLFIVDVADVVLKDAQHAMVLPFVSLSKRPRFKPIIYENKETGQNLVVTGSEPFGIATIWDYDIMLWMFGQIRKMIDDGQTPTRHFGFSAYDCLRGIHRDTGKYDYTMLENAFQRLLTTSILTNVGNSHPKGVGAGWLDNYIFHRSAKSGRLEHIEVWVNQWIYDKVIDSSQILTLHQNYFLLTGGVARFLYRTARKMAGTQQQGFGLKMSTLFKNSGAVDQEHFISEVRRIAANNDHKTNALPEYRVMIERIGHNLETEFVRFVPREYQRPTANKKPIERGASDFRYRAGTLALSDDAIDEALNYCRAHDLDYQSLYEQWRSSHVKASISENGHGITHPGRRFMAYLRGVVRKRG